MTDQEPLAEVDSAPAPEATAAPEEPQQTPEVAASEESKPAEKMYTQAEIDAMISKRLAREQRKWERERAQQPAAQLPKEVPPVDQFESPEAYAEALAEKKAQELIAKREAQQQQAQVLEAYHDREEAIREKYDDFEQVAYNPKLPITDVMAQTIQASDVGPEVAYYLGSNPQEAARISRLTPFLQAKEIGRIEAKLASDPAPLKKSTSAPSPITPVTNRATAIAYDTTDPRAAKTMSTSEWIEADRARQMRKLQAQINR